MLIGNLIMQIKNVGWYKLKLISHKKSLFLKKRTNKIKQVLVSFFSLALNQSLMMAAESAFCGGGTRI